MLKSIRSITPIQKIKYIFDDQLFLHKQPKQTIQNRFISLPKHFLTSGGKCVYFGGILGRVNSFQSWVGGIAIMGIFEAG
jgi:hypothetical protein